MLAILDRPNNALSSNLVHLAVEPSQWAFAKTGVSNDNAVKPRSSVRESFSAEEFVSTRRRLKVQSASLSEGAVGRIIRVRSPGRLYDVSFPSAGATVITLSHCDIARTQACAH